MKCRAVDALPHRERLDDYLFSFIQSPGGTLILCEDSQRIRA
jgi:hypothetical protein